MSRFQQRLQLYWMVCPDRLNSLPNRVLRRIVKIAALPLFIFRYPWVVKPDMTALPYLEMPLTTSCTLRCAQCSNLMQYYNHPWELPPEDAFRYIDLVVNTVDRVFDYGLIGGETFLYPHLAEVVDYLCRIKKVGRISLTTNATVLPDDEALLSALAHRKVYVKISDYGALSHRLKELAALFDARGIKYRVLDLDDAWYDFGDLRCRGRDAETLRRQFKSCASGCRSYVRGQLHVCPRSGHGVDLGLIPEHKADYADLDGHAPDRKTRRKAVRRLLERDFVTACDYCDKGTPHHVPVPAAVQASPGGQGNV